MKDKELASQALNMAGIVFEVHDNLITMTSKSWRQAQLDLGTGVITGDSDFGHSSEQLGLLRQYYGEASARLDCLKAATIIDERLMNVEGDIILMWTKPEEKLHG
jgi:hypothetical protein